MKTFPFVPFSTSSRVQSRICRVPALSIFDPRLHLPREIDRQDTKDEWRVKRKKRSVCSLKREPRRRLLCPRIIMNLSLSLFLPGTESGLPDPPGARRNNGKRAYYYFIIVHVGRNAYLPLHYRGHLRCELLRLVTGTLLHISDTLLQHQYNRTKYKTGR